MHFVTFSGTLVFRNGGINVISLKHGLKLKMMAVERTNNSFSF